MLKHTHTHTHPRPLCSPLGVFSAFWAMCFINYTSVCALSILHDHILQLLLLWHISPCTRHRNGLVYQRVWHTHISSLSSVSGEVPTCRRSRPLRIKRMRVAFRTEHTKIIILLTNLVMQYRSGLRPHGGALFNSALEKRDTWRNILFWIIIFSSS